MAFDHLWIQLLAIGPVGEDLGLAHQWLEFRSRDEVLDLHRDFGLGVGVGVYMNDR